MVDTPQPPAAPGSPSVIGSTINSLPLEKMFTVPAKAFADTQVALSRQYFDFVNQVGFESVKDAAGNPTSERKLVMVEASFDEPTKDALGNINGQQKRTIKVPLLSILEHPNVNVVEAGIEFELTIQTAEEQSSKSEFEGKADITVGWGPFKASISARMANSSAQTRKTDTRARYVVSMKLAKGPMPEGMARFLDIVTDAVAQSAKK